MCTKLVVFGIELNGKHTTWIVYAFGTSLIAGTYCTEINFPSSSVYDTNKASEGHIWHFLPTAQFTPDTRVCFRDLFQSNILNAISTSQKRRHLDVHVYANLYGHTFPAEMQVYLDFWDKMLFV